MLSAAAAAALWRSRAAAAARLPTSPERAAAVQLLQFPMQVRTSMQHHAARATAGSPVRKD